MITCPNCGQKTSGDGCQWCHYPLPTSGPATRRTVPAAIKPNQAEIRAGKQVEIAAREKAKREAEQTKKTREAEARARALAEIAAGKKARQEAVEAEQAREAGGWA